MELHLYTGGEHGRSVANPLSLQNERQRELVEANPNIQLWVDMCANWLMDLGKLT